MNSQSRVAQSNFLKSDWVASGHRFRMNEGLRLQDLFNHGSGKNIRKVDSRQYSGQD